MIKRTITINGIDMTETVEAIIRAEITKKPAMILIHESALTSIVKDMWTYGSTAALVGIGVYFDSIVMQIIGGLIAFILLIGAMGSGRLKKDNRFIECFSFDEARKEIDRIEAKS